MRVVVSLTTLPSRLEDNKILPTLKSVNRQTRKPDAVYLGLPRKAKRTGEYYPKPSQEILDLCTVVKLPYDFGPVSKIAAGILAETDPNTIIITVDDDNDYPETFIEELVEKAKIKPKSAIGSSGVVIGTFPSYFAFIRNEAYRRYEGWFGPKVGKKGQPVDILCGYSGVLYRRGFFPKNNYDVINKFLKPPSKNKSIFLHDDVYISAYLCSKGIPRHLYILSDIKERFKPSDPISGGFQFYNHFVRAIRYCYSKGMLKRRVRLSTTTSITGRVILTALLILVLIMTVLMVPKMIL